MSGGKPPVFTIATRVSSHKPSCAIALAACSDSPGVPSRTRLISKSTEARWSAAAGGGGDGGGTAGASERGCSTNAIMPKWEEEGSSDGSIGSTGAVGTGGGGGSGIDADAVVDDDGDGEFARSSGAVAIAHTAPSEPVASRGSAVFEMHLSGALGVASGPGGRRQRSFCHRWRNAFSIFSRR